MRRRMGEFRITCNNMSGYVVGRKSCQKHTGTSQ